MGLPDWLKKKNRFKDEQEELSPIAINTWIEVYYKILFKPDENWNKERVAQFLGQQTTKIMQILSNLGQVTSMDGKKIYGFINPALNKNAILTSGFGEKGFLLHLCRNFTFCNKKSEEHKGYYEILMRSKEKEPDAKEGVRILKKNEKRSYGYSPIDFIQDKFMLFELNKQFSEYINVDYNKAEEILDIGFNVEGEPIIKMGLGFLIIEYRVKDRLELKDKNPKIEKLCFGDNLEEFTKEFRKPERKCKEVEKWLKAVDKLIETSKNRIED